MRDRVPASMFDASANPAANPTTPGFVAARETCVLALTELQLAPWP